MPRADSLVTPAERIHLITREHGVVLVRPFLRATLVVALFGGATYELARSPVPSPVRWSVALVAAVVVSISLLGLVRRVGRWNSRRLVVTDRRAVLRNGMLSRRMTAVPLEDLHDLQIHVTGPGRLLRYGAVIVSANGRRGPLLGLTRLPDPDLVFGLLMGLEEELEWYEPEPSRTRAGGALTGA
jgi:membrane protein YdbS with pleckstrin-like domain